MMSVHEFDLLWRLLLALVLSSAIGIEREMRQKAAGLRTYALVGVGSALFMLVSTYGFAGVQHATNVGLDPSRVAAQIVSGIGFIGGGIIFVRSDAVRGLTTAAGVWVTAAVGMACGGALPVLAVATTAIYLGVTYGYPWLVHHLPRSRFTPTHLQLIYADGHGVLRDALTVTSRHDFALTDLAVARTQDEGGNLVTVELAVAGRGSLVGLADELIELPGVVDVVMEDIDGTVAAG